MQEIKPTNLETNSEFSEMKLSELRTWVTKATAKAIHRIADLKAGAGANYKLRISAVERATGITWGRVKSLHYSESRRIDAHEWIRIQQAQDKAEREEIERKKHEAQILAVRTAALLSGEPIRAYDAHFCALAQHLVAKGKRVLT